MKRSLFALAAVAATLTLSGCGGLNSVLADRHETVEAYHVLDVKAAGSSADTVIKSIADGLARNTSAIVQNRPLQVGGKPVPKAPGRFELVNVADAFKGTGMAGLLAMGQGAGNTVIRVAKCDDAIWSAKANRGSVGSDNLNLYVCLYQYQSGYQLNVYSVFQKTSGGLGGLARGAAHAVVGTPEEWVNKTVMDLIRSVEQGTNTKVTYVEGQPALGDLPRVDQWERR